MKRKMSPNLDDLKEAVEDGRMANAEYLLSMLKEQGAVKIEVKKMNESGRCGRCPNCSNELNETDYPNYCGFCGRSVKWE